MLHTPVPTTHCMAPMSINHKPTTNHGSSAHVLYECIWTQQHRPFTLLVASNLAPFASSTSATDRRPLKAAIIKDVFPFWCVW